MIIFGTRTRISKSSVEDILDNACPKCGKSLCLHDLKRWFTLYFIPVIPLSTIESFYQCEGCGSQYKQEIKDMLSKNKKNSKKIEDEIKKVWAITLVACMTHMAKIDGTIAKEEKDHINKVIDKFPKMKKELQDTFSKFSKGNKGKEVEQMLIKARQLLTAEGIMMLIGQVAKVLLADGRIDKKEEKLMKEYLLICGIPKDLFPQIIDKLKKA